MNPIFVLSKSKLKEQLDKLWQLGVKINYSFKTNPEVAMLIQEEDYDVDFSSHSIKPISVIKDKKRVWFFPQGWNREQIIDLINQGVRNFVIDNINDLNIFDKVISELGIIKEITLLIRIKMKEHTVYTGRFFVYGFNTNVANDLIKEYSDRKYLKNIGIHFHRKTENVSEWNMLEELQESFDCWDKINIVNIGGGLPIEYKSVKDFNMEFIFNQIKKLKEFLDEKNIKLIVEPGRFICGPSIRLECEIINVVDRNIFVNCSVYNSFPDTIFYGLKLLVENESEDDNLRPYLIKGNTACSVDIFRYKVRFDKEPVIGDKIVFLNAGAYNFHTNFMWLDEIETVIVD